MLFSSFPVAVATAALLLLHVAAISKLSITGSRFFDESGNQFYIKGVAYQLDEHDPLLNGDQCSQDAKLMADLGANTIRVYHVDASGNHDACMKAFSDVGIYALVDLDTFTTQIEPPNAHWNQTQYEKFTAVLDEFQKYDNLAGVFVGNEVLTKPTDSTAAPYVRAAARDLKAYRDSKGYRKIPIGYSAADIGSLRPMLQNYLVCGGNASETIDFFSLNAYEWCMSSNDFHTSGYANLQNNAVDYPVPIFFSETGCNTSPPRQFADQAAILGPEMDHTWSGAIVYEWIQETNGYGLITYGDNTNPPPAAPQPAASGAAKPPDVIQGPIVRSGTPKPVTPDYSNLKAQWATLTPSGVKLSEYSASMSHLTTPNCPDATPGAWALSGNPPLPQRDQQGYNPTQTTPASATGTAAGTSASASPTKASASGERELVGMGLALSVMMFGFVIWL